MNSVVGRPAYTDPPVSEIVVGIQFQPIPELGGPLVGLFWSKVRESFPKIEQHPPLVRPTEDFGPPQLSKMGAVQFTLPLNFAPRTFLIDASGQHLLQIQSDRYLANWRLTGAPGDVKPHFCDVRDQFFKYYAPLQEVLKEQGSQPINVVECEVTYINQIEQRGAWTTFGEPEKVFRNWKAASLDGQGPESVNFALRYVLRDEQSRPYARVHAQVTPGFMQDGTTRIFALQLTARGASPANEDLGAFLERLHQSLLSAFESVMTDEIKMTWGRK